VSLVSHANTLKRSTHPQDKVRLGLNWPSGDLAVAQWISPAKPGTVPAIFGEMADVGATAGCCAEKWVAERTKHVAIDTDLRSDAGECRIGQRNRNGMLR
jgi:hypothetical protein